MVLVEKIKKMLIKLLEKLGNLLMICCHIGYSKSIEKKTNICFNNIINVLLNYR